MECAEGLLRFPGFFQMEAEGDIRADLPRWVVFNQGADSQEFFSCPGVGLSREVVEGLSCRQLDPVEL